MATPPEDLEATKAVYSKMSNRELVDMARALALDVKNARHHGTVYFGCDRLVLIVEELDRRDSLRVA